MLKVSKYLFFILIFISANGSFAAVTSKDDTTKVRKVKVLPVPAFGYSPETRAYIGAVALFTLDFYQDSLSRTSNAKLEFNYTWNKQSILEAKWNYFFREEKWFTSGDVLYSKYPDLYYGIGPNSQDSNEVTFNSNRFMFKATGLKKIKKDIFAGLGARYIQYSNVYTDSITDFDEIIANDIFEVSAIAAMDSRNNLLNTTTGHYASLSIGYNIGSVNDYVKTILDLRKYFTWKDKYTLALRFLNEFNSKPPSFYDNAFMGGDQNARGYYYGRYRDNNATTLQVETRIDLFWRIDLAVFGGASAVYSSFSTLGNSIIAPNYGIGLRILADKAENINLRFDYARGIDGQSGFYVSFGESF